MYFIIDHSGSNCPGIWMPFQKCRFRPSLISGMFSWIICFYILFHYFGFLLGKLQLCTFDLLCLSCVSNYSLQSFLSPLHFSFILVAFFILYSRSLPVLSSMFMLHCSPILSYISWFFYCSSDIFLSSTKVYFISFYFFTIFFLKSCVCTLRSSFVKMIISFFSFYFLVNDEVFRHNFHLFFLILWCAFWVSLFSLLPLLLVVCQCCASLNFTSYNGIN